MRKINYVRPLAEVIDLDVCDIIKTSEFSTTYGNKGTERALAIEDPDKYVNDGKIILN